MRFVVWALALAACAGEEGITDERVVVSLVPRPSDVTTRHQGALSVDGVYHGFQPVEEALPRADAEAIAERIRLVTWPEGDVRRSLVTTEYDPDDPDRVPATWRIEPEAPLESRWYALRIEPGSPSNVRMSERLFIRDDEGRSLARFRPDSFPVPVEISACPDGGTVWVSAAFSELVDTAPERDPDDLVLVVTQLGRAVECLDTLSPTQVVCDALDLARPFEVEVKPGLFSEMGVAVAAFTAASAGRGRAECALIDLR